MCGFCDFFFLVKWFGLVLFFYGGLVDDLHFDLKLKDQKKGLIMA